MQAKKASSMSQTGDHTTPSRTVGGILSDRTIMSRLGKDLLVHPMLDVEIQVAGCKIDLHLGCKFHEVKHSALSVYDPLCREHIDYIRTLILRPGDYYVIHPGALVLAPTFENVSLPADLLGILQGRTSLGRLGLIVHATAGFVDPGYHGTVVLELSNIGRLPVRLTPLLKVATIAFAKIYGVVDKPYGTKFKRSLLGDEIRVGKHDSPTFIPSRLHEDWESVVLRDIAEREPDSVT